MYDYSLDLIVPQIMIWWWQPSYHTHTRCQKYWIYMLQDFLFSMVIIWVKTKKDKGIVPFTVNINYCMGSWVFFSFCFGPVCSTKREAKLWSVHPVPSFLSPSLPYGVWSCLVSNHASGHVFPRVTSCVKGDPSPQAEVYYWPNPVGPRILTNQL